MSTPTIQHTPFAYTEEESFHDALYEWMQRAPWLAISAAAHLVLFLIVQAIPWNLFERAEDFVLAVGQPPLEKVLPEDPLPEEKTEELDLPDLLDEPVLIESPDEVDSTDTDQPDEDTAGDLEGRFDSPFDSLAFNDVIGIGSGPGKLRGGRFGSDSDRARGFGRGTHESLRKALRWLADHQDEDGHWDGDGFMKHDPPGDPCTGPGGPNHDVGLTGLALLAFLGDGSTLSRGAYKGNVSRAVAWLRDQQDFETGLIGEPIGHSYLYDHAIATLALCEAYYFSRSPLLKGTCQRSVNLITRARNPYGVWRYDVPPTGDQDSSVTGWMVFALKSAQDGGLAIDEEAFRAAHRWFEEMTDPATGRVGYDSMGSRSSRVVGVNDRFPAEKGEAMTATALLCRVFMGEDAEQVPMLEKHAELLMRSLPVWDPEGGGCDMYYWYYGTYAMFQVGGRYWKAWNAGMKSAVLGSQRGDGAAAGSWDPVGPWGYAGGRVYATATMALCLEVYFRYARVAGAR